MAKKKISKKEKVWKVLLKNPLASAKEVAKQAGCSVKYAYMLKNDVGTSKEVLAGVGVKARQGWDKIEETAPINVDDLAAWNRLGGTTDTVRKSRSNVLAQADKLVNGARADEYGDAKQNFDDIAKMWSVLLGVDVTAQQVALCMIAVKSARLMKSDSPDSWVDICGYGALGGEMRNV